MKTQLTKQQSQHLIDLGVPKDKASRSISEGGDADILRVDGGYITKRGTIYPIFTLTDLLEILPKEIDIEDRGLCLEIQMMNGGYVVSYEYFSDGGCKAYFEAEELIDSLYELCVWCIEQGYLKF